MNLVTATLKSDNTVYAQLDADLGPESVAKTARDMGITSQLNGYPAEGLGGLTNGVSPLEMARAYATIANGGYRVKPIVVRKVTFPDGHVDDLGKPTRNKVFEDGVTYEATQILEKNVQGGTGTKAADRLPRGGQDRHGRQLHRRLVRRLHAAPGHLGLGRPPEGPVSARSQRRRAARSPRRSGART